MVAARCRETLVRSTLEKLLPCHACEDRPAAHSAHPWASRAADGASRCASTARAQPARAWVFGSRASLVPRRGLYSIYDMKTNEEKGRADIEDAEVITKEINQQSRLRTRTQSDTQTMTRLHVSTDVSTLPCSSARTKHASRAKHWWRSHTP